MAFFGSMSEVRRQIGNAVPPIGIKPIFEELFSLLQGKPKFSHVCVDSNLKMNEPKQLEFFGEAVSCD